MKTTLLATTALMLGCIDLDIIGGSETTAGSTTSMTGATSSESDGAGDGDGDPDESSSGTEGDGDGETSDSTETGTEDTETESGDGDGEIGDGDADPGDGDGEPMEVLQVCSNEHRTAAYIIEANLDCATECGDGFAWVCNVGDFDIAGPSDLVCCHLGRDCYIMATMEVCFDGDDALCQIEPG
jgi:hypothetical protein